MNIPPPALAVVVAFALFALSAPATSQSNDSDPDSTLASDAADTTERAQPDSAERDDLEQDRWALPDQMPEVLRDSEPVIPDAAREARIEGTVLVDAYVWVDGKARQMRIRKSIPMLDDAARRCVRDYWFEPAKYKGRPTPSWITIPVTFRLPPEPPEWTPAPKPRRPSEAMKSDSSSVPGKPPASTPPLPPVPVPAPEVESAAPDGAREEASTPKPSKSDEGAAKDDDAGDEDASGEDESRADDAPSEPGDDDEATGDEAEDQGEPIDASESKAKPVDEPTPKPTVVPEQLRDLPVVPLLEHSVPPITEVPRVELARDLELERALAALRRAPRRPPNADDALVREDIIRRMRASGSIPEPDAAAQDRLALLAGGLTENADRGSLRDAAAGLTDLLREWPAWATPYRELARALDLLESPGRAATCLELYLLAAPEASDWRHVRQWLKRLRDEAAQPQ